MDRLERYRQYRTVGRELNGEILSACVDREAILESARRLGIERRGDDLLYDTEEDMSVHYDFLLNEYHREGKTPVVEYRDRELYDSQAERTVLDALAEADTSLFRIERVDEDVRRLVLADLLNDEEETTMTDLNLSRTAGPGLLLFVRLVPFEEFNMSSGVWFAFHGDDRKQLLREYEEWEGQVEYQTPEMRRFVAFYDLFRGYGIPSVA